MSDECRRRIKGTGCVGGAKADIILSGKNFEKQFERYTLDCPTIFLDRLVDKNEIKEKLTPVLKDLGVL